jgi:hypothetical protein
MKEILTERRERDRRSALRKPMAIKALESDQAQEDAPAKNDASEIVPADDKADDTPRVTQPVDHEAVDILHRPAVATGIVPRLKKRYPIHSFGSMTPVMMPIAKAVQVDLEMVGSSLLGGGSALAQCRINVSAQLFGQGCPVTVNMFVIAVSGERKSSTIDMIVKPVTRQLAAPLMNAAA